jgi:hypothetical protein
MPLRRARLRPNRIEQTEVAGIRCFWGAAPPPYTATLVFRVGRADETLATSGITHLSEHLLMPAEPPRELDRNARVENLFAVFWAHGTERRALRFLEQTAALMRDPPLDRLETERKILQAEAAGRGQHAVNGSLAMRYGAAGHGLSGFDEYGLYTLDEAAVGEWIRANFTRGNAALWLTGPPPRELDLELPQGEWRPPPEPTPMDDLTFPAAFTAGGDGTVVVTTEGERTASFSVAHAVVVDRAWKQIRYEQGLAYEIGDWFEPLTADLTGVVYWVDSLDANVEPVRRALLGILEDVADSGVTEEELERELELYTEAISDPLDVPPILHAATTAHLTGEGFPGTEEWLRGRREVTRDSTAEALRPALERMLLVLPDGSGLPEGFTEVPRYSQTRVEGTAYRPSGFPVRAESRKPRLVVGDEGASLVFADAAAATVRWDTLVGVLRWPDGARTLLDLDGFRVHVEPAAWRRGKEIVRKLDERTPGELVIVMEPALTSKVDRVDEAVRTHLKRRWVTEDELTALPAELEDDEQILSLAEASRGLRAGLLVVTERRLLWLYKMFGERRLELPYEEIRSAAVRKKLGETNLELETTAEKLSFTDISPKERAAEIVAIVDERVSRTSAAPA